MRCETVQGPASHRWHMLVADADDPLASHPGWSAGPSFQQGQYNYTTKSSEQVLGINIVLVLISAYFFVIIYLTAKQEISRTNMLM